MTTTTISFDVERIKQSVFAYHANHVLMFFTAIEQPRVLHEDHSAMLLHVIREALGVITTRFAAYVAEVTDTIDADGMLHIAMRLPQSIPALPAVFGKLEFAATHWALAHCYSAEPTLSALAEEHRAKYAATVTEVLQLLAVEDDDEA